MKNQRLFIILAAVIAILSIPLIAMQFTSEVEWTAFDFLVMGILLTTTGLLCEWILRKVKTTKGRITFCGLVLLGFFAVWVELATGNLINTICKLVYPIEG